MQVVKTNTSAAPMRHTAKTATGTDRGHNMDLAGLLRTLWRGKFLIVLVTLCALSLGIFYAYFMATPIFRSTAVIMLDTREENVVDFESVVSGLSADRAVINTELQVLSSRTLLGRVVDELSLNDDPEFNRLLRAPSLFQKFKNAVRDQLGLTSRVSVPADAASRALRTREATIDGLLAQVSVSNIPQSLVFEVSASTTDPIKSKRVADKLAEFYIADQLNEKFEATQQATIWLSARVADLKIELEAAEAKVKSFSASIDLVSREGLEGLERQTKDIRDRVADLAARVEQQRTQLDAFEVASDRVQQLAALGTPEQLERLLLGTLSQPGEPGAELRFDQRAQQIAARLQLDLTRNESQLELLRGSLQELEAQLQQQSDDLIRLQQLNREAEASRVLYEAFLSRLKETSVQQGIQQADSRLLSNAVIPVGPALPRKSVILVVSVFFGFMLGAAFLVIRELRSSTFRDAQTLEQVTGYPVIGQVPIIPGRRRLDAITYLAKKPTSAAAEAIRNLRTSLLLSDMGHPPQVIMTSSSYPGEGKTTIAFALAQNLAMMGRKVILLEGDVRRLVMRQYFAPDHKPGLISVLERRMPLSEALYHADKIGCDILLGEDSQKNPADILSSKRLETLLDELRETYDFVIIDMPPVMVVPDARIVARLCDAVVFLVKWDSTQRESVVEALQMFESVGTSVTGVVLNQINARAMARYGYGYGAYSKYGRKYYNN